MAKFCLFISCIIFFIRADGQTLTRSQYTGTTNLFIPGVERVASPVSMLTEFEVLTDGTWFLVFKKKVNMEIGGMLQNMENDESDSVLINNKTNLLYELEKGTFSKYIPVLAKNLKLTIDSSVIIEKGDSLTLMESKLYRPEVTPFPQIKENHSGIVKLVAVNFSCSLVSSTKVSGGFSPIIARLKHFKDTMKEVPAPF